MAQYTETIRGRLRGVDLLQRDLQRDLQKIQDTIAREGVIWWYEELRKLWAEYRCRPLGFNLIRWLHDYHGTRLDGSICRISIGSTDWDFPEHNTSHPGAISDDDRRRYALALAALAASRGLDPDPEPVWADRFHAVISADRWPGENGKNRALCRRDVLDIGLVLGAGRDQTDMLLFKTFENDSISLLRSEDLVHAYALEMGDVTRQQRDALLLRYRQDIGTKPKPTGNDDADNMTQDRYFDMEDVLEGLHQIPDPAERQEAFYEWLVDNAHTLDLHSRTAHRVYCNLIDLLYRCLHDGEKIGDPVAAIYRCCIASRIPSLMPGEYDRVCQDLLYHTGGWRYLSFNKSGHMQVARLDGRISQLLRMEEPVQKNDVLFLCFYICASVWQGGSPDPDRLHSFTKKVNSILKFALLPTIYLGHTLDLSIAQCIMMGRYSLDYYMDLVDNDLLAESAKDTTPRNRTDTPKAATQKSEQILNESQRKKLQTAARHLQLDLEGLDERILAHWKAYSGKRMQFILADGTIRWTLSQESRPTQTSLLCPIPDRLQQGAFCACPRSSKISLVFKGKPMTLEDFIRRFLTDTHGELTAEQQVYTGQMAVLYALCAQLEQKHGGKLTTRVNAKDQIKLTIQ